MRQKIVDSPVEIERKLGQNGDGSWAGYDAVWSKIQSACEKMALDKQIYLSAAHIDAMADLGSGHEERMKRRLMWLREYGWVK